MEVIEYPRSRKVWRTKSVIRWIASLRDKESPQEERNEEELFGVCCKQDHEWTLLSYYRPPPEEHALRHR